MSGASADDLAAIAKIAEEGGLAWAPRAEDLDRYEILLSRDPDPVGFLVGAAVEGEGEIHLVGVARRARRRGVGRGLVAAFAARASLRAIFLEVRATDGGAVAFYEALGFAPIGRRARYYADGTEALLLRLEIDGLPAGAGSSTE